MKVGDKIYLFKNYSTATHFLVDYIGAVNDHVVISGASKKVETKEGIKFIPEDIIYPINPTIYLKPINEEGWHFPVGSVGQIGCFTVKALK